jgi:hypothetical protein
MNQVNPSTQAIKLAAAITTAETYSELDRVEIRIDRCLEAQAITEEECGELYAQLEEKEKELEKTKYLGICRS